MNRKYNIMMWVAATIFVVIALQSVSASLNDSLVAYYTFDDNFSDSINSNNLDSWGMSINANGKIGGCAYASDYSNYANGTITGLSLGDHDRSVVYWVNYSSSYDSYGSSFTFGIDADPQKWDIGSSETQTATDFGGNQQTGTGGITKNKWSFVAFVYNASASKVYVYLDGQLNFTFDVVDSQLGSNEMLLNVYNFNHEGIVGCYDEVGIWNRALSSEEVNQLYNGGVGMQYPFDTFIINLIHPNDNSRVTQKGTYFNVSFNKPGSISLLNIEYDIWKQNQTGDWVLFNQTTHPLASDATSDSQFIDNFVFGQYKWGVKVQYIENSVTKEKFAGNNTFSVGLSVLNISYPTHIYETQEQTISALIQTLPDAIVYDASLNYSGIIYSATVESLGGGNYSISSTFTTPQVDADTTRSFNFIVKYNTQDNYEETTDNYEQNVSNVNPIVVTTDTCSVGYHESRTFSFVDEQNLTNLNATIEYNIPFGIDNTSSFIVYGNITTPSSQFRICIPSELGLKTGLSEIDYKANGYSKRSYYLYEGSVLSNESTTHTDLYLLPEIYSTTFSIDVKNTFLNPYKDKVLSLMRWYPSLNTYHIVEMERTDDTGTAVVKLLTEDANYRVSINEKNGSLLYLASPVKMTCSAEPCTYSIKVVHEISNYFKLYGTTGLQINLTYDDTGNRFIARWSDPQQLTKTMRLYVYRLDYYSTTSICNATSSDTVGLLSCSLPSNQSGRYVAELYWDDGSGEITVDKLIKRIGETGFLNIELIIMIVMVLIFVTAAIFISPIVSLIGIIIASAFLLISGSAIPSSVLVTIMLLSFIIIYLIKRNV